MWRAWGGRKPRRGKASQGTYIRWRGVSLDGADLRAPLSGVLAYAGGGESWVVMHQSKSHEGNGPVWPAARGRGLYEGQKEEHWAYVADGRVQPGTGRFGEGFFV